MVRFYKFFRMFLMTIAVLGGALSSTADPLPEPEQVILQVGWEDPTIGQGDHPRSPIQPPRASLDDYTLNISGVHSGYTLYLIDDSSESPTIIYMTSIPAGINVVVLPSTLSGNYKLCLYPEGCSYYFYGDIEL